MRTLINKTLYALLFLIIVPVILWFWAKQTADQIALPIIHSIDIGWVFAIVGICLISCSMFYLIRVGKGLPMNAFPPPKLVTSGPYYFFRHPIYIGFGLFIIGYFILTGSSSGLWLVTPVTILSLIALVIGYEAIDLRERFPNSKYTTFFDLPKRSNSIPNFSRRVSALLLVITPLILGNYIITLLFSLPKQPLENSTILYVFSKHSSLILLCTIFILIVPLIIKNSDLLRDWVIKNLLALGIYYFCILFYNDISADFIMVKGYSIYFVPVFLILISTRIIFSQFRKLRVLILIIALVLILIQLSFSANFVYHLSGSILLFLISDQYFKIWCFVRKKTEIIANSWKEWMFGKLRIINHGIYVGVGTFLGICLVGVFVGNDYAWSILVFSVVVILFSALWAQIIEGSEKLKRPFGYYGALVGIIFASLAVSLMGYDVWVIIGAISVVMPWVQAMGRLRCLVNGCCHGGKTNHPYIGIRYYHYRSRVCGVSNLKGELLHPTPLYSIISLIVIGFILLSLLISNYSCSFIFGLYLILTGIGRFVEETYRGEVQTPIIKGLRLYQWTAILSLAIGICMTFISQGYIPPSPKFGWETIIAALIGGLFTTFAMGVDFPSSNLRFSRLV